MGGKYPRLRLARMVVKPVSMVKLSYNHCLKYSELTAGVVDKTPIIKPVN